MLYGRLDELRREAAARLSRVWAEGSGGTHQARSERDASAVMYSERLAQVNAVEGGLCFGRLDHVDGERLYIGRLGIMDEDNDYEPLLVDWRAGAARPFYCATAASPEGVRRRRHIYTRGRVVTGFDDDVFDLESLSDRERGELNGEAALMAALGESRTGRMRDIVSTIQAEQDNVIRAGRDGVLVVQGGPGTGKTAVALHRAGYLLYTYREALSRRGVLIVGPNPTFLRYIDQVLPSLGETDALLRTVGELYPGVVAAGWEPAESAAVKGRAGMAKVLAAAVADRQALPSGETELVVEGLRLRLDRRVCERAREAARRSLLPHNQARRAFERGVLAALTRQAADLLSAIVPAHEEIPLAEGESEFGELFSTADVDEIHKELAGADEFEAAMDELWPRLAPTELLEELYASDDRMAAAGLGPAERGLLRRAPGSPWTPADAPLLDEAAELLGASAADEAARAAARAELARELEYAEGVMDLLDLPETATPEILHAADVLDARHLAARVEVQAAATTAERAAADRTWTFGHVIVDEAQELSAMAWRVLMRRCPTRSMTVVGDIAQTGALGGASSWESVLSPLVGSRWRLAELTVNYRTPAEVMEVAADVLAGVDAALAPPRSVRSAGVDPWSLRVSGVLADELAAVAAEEAAAVGGGRLAIIVPASLVSTVATAVPAAALGAEPSALEHTTVVLTVEQSKGLEFDSVLIVEPSAILAESPRGGSDLYVALTRTTRRLGVLHTSELPAVLRRLRERDVTFRR